MARTNCHKIPAKIRNCGFPQFLTGVPHSRITIGVAGVYEQPVLLDSETSMALAIAEALHAARWPESKLPSVMEMVKKFADSDGKTSVRSVVTSRQQGKTSALALFAIARVMETGENTIFRSVDESASQRALEQVCKILEAANVAPSTTGNRKVSWNTTSEVKGGSVYFTWPNNKKPLDGISFKTVCVDDALQIAPEYLKFWVLASSRSRWPLAMAATPDANSGGEAMRDLCEPDPTIARAFTIKLDTQ